MPFLGTSARTSIAPQALTTSKVATGVRIHGCRVRTGRDVADFGSSLVMLGFEVVVAMGSSIAIPAYRRECGEGKPEYALEPARAM